MSDTTLRMKENWRQIAALSNDQRSASRICEHYILEKELASRLLRSSADDRCALYTQLYDELFTKLPDHPQHTRSGDGNQGAQDQIDLLEKLVPRNSRFVEIGAGDCRVSLGVAEHCLSVTALDVSECVQGDGEKPANFSFVKIDGTHLPLPDESVDFFYSNQLMEHLHPDDALIQLDDIYRVLVKGGAYFCITPHAFTGPHDISKYFDDFPTGFHLAEYHYAELMRLFHAARFSKTSIIWARRGRHIIVPSFLGVWIEKMLAGLLGAHRSQLSTYNKIRGLLGIMLLGHKGAST